ncbi:MAG: alkaline phosphatase D family protein [Pyrinomonadaceae bacterium]
MRRFNAQIPQFVQWDDHETYNNWYPGRMLDDARYAVRDCRVLARARRAFLDYQPLRFNPSDPERIFRAYNYGPSVALLMLDERSYRGRNSPNRQRVASHQTAFLGRAQMRGLKSQLLATRATWKVIASDMPVGLIVRDGKDRFENAANGDGPAFGREHELAELLRFIKTNRVKNVVWITADVHYAAAHHYDPARAEFTNFNEFWEFVAGPLHAGTFGPGEMDNTFGPQVKFTGIPPGMRPNRPPSDGFSSSAPSKSTAAPKR